MFTSSKIKSIKSIGVRDVYDITVENDHSYVGNGIVCHNSSKPNLQNIPRGPRIRGMFVPSPGTALLFADLSQAEMRLMADYAEDKVMIQMVNSKVDVHWEGCKKLFYHDKVLTYDSKDPEMKRFRKLTKLCNFGRLYGAGTKKVIKSVNEKLEKGEERLTEAIAEAHGEWFFSTFYRIAEYLKEVEDFILSNGYIDNKFGRRRHLPDAFVADKMKRAAALREGINAQIQGQASDIVQLAAIRINKVLKEQNLKSQFLMSIHDELGYEVPLEELEIMKKLVPQEMISKAGFPMNMIDIDLESEVSIYYNRWNND